MIAIKSIHDERGALTVIEKPPFPIKRVYWLHDVPSDAMRGGHAHKLCRRIFVALNGRFEARVGGKIIDMHRPDRGLLVEPMTWVELHGFSRGAICLVLASEEHDDDECIRTREEFERLQ